MKGLQGERGVKGVKGRRGPPVRKINTFFQLVNTFKIQMLYCQLCMLVNSLLVNCHLTGRTRCTWPSQKWTNTYKETSYWKTRWCWWKFSLFSIVFSLYESFICAHVIIKDKLLGRGVDTCPRGCLGTKIMESLLGPKGPKMTLPQAATSWDSCTHIWKMVSAAQWH